MYIRSGPNYVKLHNFRIGLSGPSEQNAFGAPDTLFYVKVHVSLMSDARRQQKQKNRVYLTDAPFWACVMKTRLHLV